MVMLDARSSMLDARCALCHFNQSAAKWRIRRVGTPADGLRVGTTTPGGVTKRASASGERESNLLLLSDYNERCLHSGRHDKNPRRER